MEEPIRAIRAFAGAISRVAETLPDDDSVIIMSLADVIQDHVRTLDQIHEFFFRFHHSNRERFEREGWPGGDSEQSDHRPTGED